MYGQVVGSGIARRKPNGSVSHKWLRCISEDEIQWGMTTTLCHTAIKVAYRLYGTIVILVPYPVISRHIFNEKSDGIKSQPKYDAAPHKRNTGSPSLACRYCNDHQHGDGVPIVLNRLPVMGLAIGKQSNRRNSNKVTVMKPKKFFVWGKWNSFCAAITNEREVC